MFGKDADIDTQRKLRTIVPIDYTEEEKLAALAPPVSFIEGEGFESGTVSGVSGTVSDGVSGSNGRVVNLAAAQAKAVAHAQSIAAALKLQGKSNSNSSTTTVPDRSKDGTSNVVIGE